VSKADSGRHDDILRRLQSQCSSLELHSLNVPHKVRNERCARALSLSGVPQSGHVVHASRKVSTCCWRRWRWRVKVFGLGQGQLEMLDALVLFVEGNDIGDRFFITLNRDK
jgi:hypothetical protein